MSILVPDPYESVYQFEKMKDPSFQYGHIRVQKDHLRAVDKLLESIGPREEVRTESDWNAVQEIFKFYDKFWPDNAREFLKNIPDIRSTRNSGGYSEEKEIRYIGALPPILMRLIKIAFPNQQWNKEFSNKFVKRFKSFNVGGMI